jgi:hypothetical protein
MKYLDVVSLSALMDQTRGHPDILVGLIDGPVATTHPDLTAARIRQIPGNNGGMCRQPMGLGDVVKRVTYAMGIKPCGGCETRAAALNRWMVFSGRHFQ